MDYSDLFSVFPGGCESYQGPNPVLCYSMMWMGLKCLETGLGYPGNLNSDEQQKLDELNLE